MMKLSKKFWEIAGTGVATLMVDSWEEGMNILKDDANLFYSQLTETEKVFDTDTFDVDERTICTAWRTYFGSCWDGGIRVMESE